MDIGKMSLGEFVEYLRKEKGLSMRFQKSIETLKNLTTFEHTTLSLLEVKAYLEIQNSSSRSK